ncbi:hypothetical protein ECC02_011350 [Trypanosoma cruzi]|uniref:Uncharacterized protein n=1 Tax=Trypanosoma cruzi TaxID=5693 RepID=A0A7J6XNB3_TRYCR|nr:hypothetical protein ECC02_011350 [Trypanosoma cruzi]
MLLQSRSKCNLFYGREACNVKPPNIDVAILLGARVLVDVTATGDINGVTAAKRSCSFVRQSAGRPPHLPAPGMAWNLLEEGSRLLRRGRSNAPLRSSYMQPKPQHRDRVWTPSLGPQEKPQCLLLSSGILLDVLMRTSAHRFLQTTPHTCDTSCAVRGTTLTITRDTHAPSVRTASKIKKHGCVRVTAKHPLAITSQASPQAAPAALQATG